MADLDLDAIEARAKAARAGPFEVKPAIFNEDGELDASVRSSHPDHRSIYTSFYTGVEPENVIDLDQWEPAISKTEEAAVKASDGWRNAEFVANARADVLALVAEVRELRERAHVNWPRDFRRLLAEFHHLQRRLTTLRRSLRANYDRNRALLEADDAIAKRFRKKQAVRRG